MEALVDALLFILHTSIDVPLKASTIFLFLAARIQVV